MVAEAGQVRGVVDALAGVLLALFHSPPEDAHGSTPCAVSASGARSTADPQAISTGLPSY